MWSTSVSWKSFHRIFTEFSPNVQWILAECDGVCASNAHRISPYRRNIHGMLLKFPPSSTWVHMECIANMFTLTIEWWSKLFKNVFQIHYTYHYCIPVIINDAATQWVSTNGSLHYCDPGSSPSSPLTKSRICLAALYRPLCGSWSRMALDNFSERFLPSIVLTMVLTSSRISSSQIPNVLSGLNEPSMRNCLRVQWIYTSVQQ